MITEKRKSLRRILESSDGVHLTAYLENRNSLPDLQNQLKECISEAYEWLYSVQSIEERKKFLEPLDSLQRNPKLLSSLKGNVGIFRTKDSFRVLSLPVAVQRQCFIASSFHVKPLLRWIQADQGFMILGVNQKEAHIYYGNQESLRKWGSIPIENEDSGLEQIAISFSKLKERIEEAEPKQLPRLFLAGENYLTERVRSVLKYKKIVKTPVLPFFEESDLNAVCRGIRALLAGDTKRKLDQAFVEFRYAEDLDLTKNNIFQIARAAIDGRIRKLLVADGLNIFGKLNKKTGRLNIHPFDLDHEDDDILDDLAQAVLASGGEVIVAPRDEIPKGRPALAIVEPQHPELEKKKDMVEFELLKQRSAIRSLSFY